MPTYEYRCTACRHEFETFQSMKDKPLRTCPACGKAALERLIGTGAAIIFKGSGFYQTDYRSESYKRAAEADSKAGKPEAAPAAKKPAEKTGEKPAEKTPAAKPAAGADSAAAPAAPAKPAPPEPKPKPSSRKRAR